MGSRRFEITETAGSVKGFYVVFYLVCTPCTPMFRTVQRQNRCSYWCECCSQTDNSIISGKV